MFEIFNIQIGKKHELYSYMEEVTSKYKNLYNVSNFYIRQIMFGVHVEPNKRIEVQKQIFKIVEDNLKIYDKTKINTLNKTLTKINNNKELSEQERHELYNKALKKAYPCKQIIEDNWFLGYNKLEAVLKYSNNPDYRALPAQLAQQAIKDCIHDWNVYFATSKDYKKNPSKYLGKPKIPNYKKGVRTTATFTNNRTTIKKINNQYYLKFLGSDKLLKLNNYVDGKRLAEVRVIPFYDKYKIALVFGEKEELTTSTDNEVFESKRIMGIDLGVNNFASISNNVGINPTIIKGGFMKAENQYYNKKRSFYTSILKEYKLTKNLCRISRNRANRLKDYFYKISHWILKFAKEHQIDTIIVGDNQFWKQEVHMDHINNQNFVSIPYHQFKMILATICTKNNIHIIFREESYTSKSSFLDMDFIPTYDKEKKCTYKFSGRRIKRGLYKSKDGILINADINASSNIIRKEFPDTFKNMDLKYLWDTTNVVNYRDLYPIQT